MEQRQAIMGRLDVMNGRLNAVDNQNHVDGILARALNGAAVSNGRRYSQQHH